VSDNRNMAGAEDFVRALISGAPIWPNDWGQAVAHAAFVVHSRRNAEAEGGTIDARLAKARRELRDLSSPAFNTTHDLAATNLENAAGLAGYRAGKTSVQP